MMFDPRTRVRGQASGSSQVINWMAQPLVRSVQRGTVTLAGTSSDATLSRPVLVQNSVLAFIGDVNQGGLDTSDVMTYLTLVNGSTVRATRQNNFGGLAVGYQVVEYIPGVLRSNQSGVIDMAGGGSATSTLSTAVDPTKAQLSWLGLSVAFGTALNGTLIRLDVTNATTITASCEIAIFGHVSYQIIEFN